MYSGIRSFMFSLVQYPIPFASPDFLYSHSTKAGFLNLNPFFCSFWNLAISFSGTALPAMPLIYSTKATFILPFLSVLGVMALTESISQHDCLIGTF